MHDGADAVHHALVALLVSRVVDEGCLDAFGGRHAGDACNDTAGHTGGEAAEGGQSTGFRVFELIFDRVEGEEADAIFAYATDDERGAAFVECRDAFGLVDIENDFEWVSGCRLAFLLAELYPGFRKLEWVLDRVSGTCRFVHACRCCDDKLTVAAPSTAPAKPPARSETMAGVLGS